MSDFADYARVVSSRIAELEAAIEQHSRRLDNVVKEARVKKVDPETGTAEVTMNGLDSDKLPWTQRGGAIRDWSPPTEGERVMVLNPSGEPGLGVILPGGFSDQYKQPHNKGGEYKLDVGSSSILVTGSKILLTVDGTTLELTGSGLKAVAADYQFD